MGYFSIICSDVNILFETHREHKHVDSDFARDLLYCAEALSWKCLHIISLLGLPLAHFIQ
jgi:hypothetical protein